MKNLKKYLLVTSLFLVVVIFLANISGYYVKMHPSGGFPYSEYASREKLPNFLRFLTNFDGTQYLIIAESGYFTYQQAYFPLYPLLASVIGRYLLLGNTPLALILISFVSFVISLWLLGKIFADREFEEMRVNPYLILLLPGSFFFVSAYTESLFLMLFLASIWLARSKNNVFSLITSTLLGLTRLIGVFTALVIFTVTIKNGKLSKYTPVVLSLGPLLGLLAYMAYLYMTTGDPLAFVSSQKAFNNARSTSSIVLLPQVIYRYLKIILTVRNFDVVYLVSIVELVMFTIYAWLLALEGLHLWRGWRSGKRYYELRTALLAFSVANIILPTLTGTFSSIPRYGLMSLSLIPAFFALKGKWQIIFALLFSTLNIIMLALFAHGWFVS